MPGSRSPRERSPPFPPCSARANTAQPHQLPRPTRAGQAGHFPARPLPGRPDMDRAVPVGAGGGSQAGRDRARAGVEEGKGREEGARALLARCGAAPLPPSPPLPPFNSPSSTMAALAARPSAMVAGKCGVVCGVCGVRAPRCKKKKNSEAPLPPIPAHFPETAVRLSVFSRTPSLFAGRARPFLHPHPTPCLASCVPCSWQGWQPCSWPAA